MSRTLILGGGFGGITVATELRRRLGSGHEIVLVDRRAEFVMGLRKLWAVAGIGSLEDGLRPRKRLSSQGIRFVQGEIRSIEPAARRVKVGDVNVDADHVVVALGAVPRPDLVEGLAEHGHDVWAESGVPGLRGAIERLQRGRVLILIAGVPYTCPPGPYECAMLLDDHLRARGIRDDVEIAVATVQPMLLPNAGREGSAWLAEHLEARGIAFRTGCRIRRVEAGRVVLENGDLPFDVLVGVPPHRVPEVVATSGLGAKGGWIDVDPATLATRHPGVFAIGDVTRIELANGLPFPKAGVTAEAAGLRVAAAIAADILGEDPPPPFDGRGHCFLEMGRTSAALIEGEFFARPEPRVRLAEPSSAHADAKRRFESERLARWFGG